MLNPRAAVRKMAAYSPPTAGRAGKLRLDFNENTQGCSARVAELLREKVTAERLAIYPEYNEERARLARHFGVDEGEMLLTNGTDEAIQVLLNTFVEKGAHVLLLEPSYAMYRFYAELAGARVEAVSYRPETLAFPLEELIAALDSQTRAVLISNPNNPTGTAVSREMIERILAAAPQAAVFVDEAYFEFCGITALPLLAECANLFVSRTFSKAYGMAGLRCGCLFSQAHNIAWARKAQSPYSVNTLAAPAAVAAIEDQASLRAYVEEVGATRSWLYDELARRGIAFYRSAGNFVLVRLGARVAEICARLRDEGVLIRDRSYELPGCARVTVGTRAQAEHFLAELERVR